MQAEISPRVLTSVHIFTIFFIDPIRGCEVFMKLTVAFLSLILFSFYVSAQQDDYIIDPVTNKAIPNFAGKVVLKKGRGKAYFKLGKNGEEILLKHGSRLKKGHILRTEAQSFVRIVLVDDTVINIAPKSVIHLEEWAFKEKKDRKMVLNFLKGQLRANFKNKAKPGDLEIKTPTTAMGIRGTIVLANVSERKDKRVVTELALLTGSARVTNKVSGKKYSLKKADHYIQFSDKRKNLLAEGLKRFDSATYENLLAREVSDDEGFTPFLDYYKGEIEESSSGSGRVPSSVGAGRGSRGGSYGKRRKADENEGWRNKLDQLNERLNEYNGD